MQLLVLLTAATTGLVITLLAWNSDWRKSALLVLLLLISQAAALQMIDAPNYTIYQHYPAWHELVSIAPWFGVILFQFLLCMSFLYPHVNSALQAIWQRTGAWRLALFLSTVAFMAAVPTISPARYVGETILSLLVMAAAALNLLLIAIHVPASGVRQIDHWLSQRIRLAPHHERPSSLEHLFPWVLAACTTFATALVSLKVFEAMPHIQDSVAYLFQARSYASGHVYLPSPPNAAAFELTHLIDDGNRWFSRYPPGWPAVLSLGVLAGTPWLVNPVIAGLTVLAAHTLLRKFHAAWTANLVVLLLASSPWFLFMSGSHMAHSASLLWLLLALLSVEQERVRLDGAWAALAGLCMAALFLTRPLEAILVGPIVLTWGLLGREPRWRLRSVGAFLLAGAALSALIFPFNYVLTDDALLTPFTHYSNIHYGPGADVLGFGPGVGVRNWPHIDPLPGHGLADVVLNLNKNMFMTNHDLFGWMAGSLLAVLIALILWRWRGADLMWLTLLAAIALGYSFWWYSGGPSLGARYWYPTLVALLVIAVRGMQVLASNTSGEYVPERFRRLLVTVMVAVLCASITFNPWRAWTKYYRYRAIGSDITTLLDEVPAGSIVVLRSDRSSDYEALFNRNPIDLANGETVIVRDAGPASIALLRDAYPDRAVYLVERQTDQSPLQWRGLLP